MGRDKIERKMAEIKCWHLAKWKSDIWLVEKDWTEEDQRASVHSPLWSLTFTMLRCLSSSAALPFFFYFCWQSDLLPPFFIHACSFVLTGVEAMEVLAARPGPPLLPRRFSDDFVVCSPVAVALSRGSAFLYPCLTFTAGVYWPGSALWHSAVWLFITSAGTGVCFRLQMNGETSQSAWLYLVVVYCVQPGGLFCAYSSLNTSCKQFMWRSKMVLFDAKNQKLNIQTLELDFQSYMLLFSLNWRCSGWI